MLYFYICLNVLMYFCRGVLSTDDDACCSTESESKNRSPKNGSNVLLISFDGFRWDYFNMVDTPVLNSFKKLGVHAKYVKNVIPTETFPNHITLATGLYPESHGIVSNRMYDPVFKSSFNMTVTDPKWWWSLDVEPIWHTNERQGGISGVCYWPGFNVDGYRPTYYADKEGRFAIPYHGKKNLMSYEERVDSVIKWLKEDKPPNFLMLYFGQLDESGHEYGYGSVQSLQEVLRLDNITGYLLDQFTINGLLDKWNIIITSDHGMTNLSLTRVINISKYVNDSDYDLHGDSGVFLIWPRKGKMDKIYNQLKNAHPNMKAYLKKDIPKSYHYQDNQRIAPIVLMLDEGWMLNTKRYLFNLNTFYPGGHGYLNTYSSMWPLFLGRGPTFKKGYHSSPFESNDIYSLMCKILGIRPQPNNGSLGIVRHLLSENSSKSSISPILIGVIVTTTFFALGVCIFAITMCISHKKMKRTRGRTRNTKVIMSELEQTSNPLLDDCDDDDDDDDEFTEVTNDHI